jgi:hypothetical protein
VANEPIPIIKVKRDVESDLEMMMRLCNMPQEVRLTLNHAKDEALTFVDGLR